MTDVETFTMMLATSKEEFNKRKVGGCWVIDLTQKDIEIHFKADGSFQFMHNSR